MYYKFFIDIIFQHLSVLSILEHLLLFIEEVGLELPEADTFHYGRKVLTAIHHRQLEREARSLFIECPKGFACYVTMHAMQD